MQIKIKVLVFCLAIASTMLGQQNDNSPYSRFGIGEISDNNFNHSRQMAGLGASYLDGYHINIVNPASYSFLNSTAFDIGLFAKRTWIEDSKTTTKIWSGNLDYISLAFPLTNPINEVYDGVQNKYKLGMAITLMPHSTVGYNISSLDSLAGIGVFNRNYIGTGGTYKLLWGNSIRYKDFSFGVNAGYLFGKIQYERNAVYQASEFAYNTIFSNNYNVSGFLWNAGLMYTKVLNAKELKENRNLPSKRISLGLHANSATGFNTSSNINDRLLQQITSSVFNIDTINSVLDSAGSGRLPAEFGLGLTFYSGEKSAIGINYSTSLWSQYFNEAAGDLKGELKNANKLSIGGYYRPNYKSFDNFFERIYYRYGAYYNTDPRVVANEQIKTYGVTMGFGMPFVFQRKISHVNLGLNLGVRGQNTPISEKFVKITLGVTFNDDEWFLKKKYY